MWPIRWCIVRVKSVHTRVSFARALSLGCLASVGLASCLACFGTRALAQSGQLSPLAVCDSTSDASVIDTVSAPATSAWRASWKQIPGGFAGVRISPQTHKWVIMLVDTSKAAEARDTLLRLHSKKETRLSNTLTRGDLKAAGVERVRWSSTQLQSWMTFLTPILLQEAKDSGAVVHGFGVNAAQNALAAYVADERSREIVTRVLGRKSIPCNLLVIGIGQPIVPRDAR